MKADAPQSRNGSKCLAADLGPAKDEAQVRPGGTEGGQSRFGVDSGRKDDFGAGPARGRGDVGEIGVAIGRFGRKRQHNGGGVAGGNKRPSKATVVP